MTPEGKVKKKIKQYLKTVPNCWFFSPIGGPYSVHGVPDIVGCIGPQFFAIEVKAPGREGTVTARQQSTMEEIIFAGSIAFMASNVDTVRAMLKLRGLDVP